MMTISLRHTTLLSRDLSSTGMPTTSSSNGAAQVSPSIVVIIIVLTIIFFLSAFLHLLIRWLARNPRGIRGSNGRSMVTLTALQGQLQQLFHMQDSGIDQALIDVLPVFVYKSVMKGLKEGADCAICLCEFQSDDHLRLLPSCSHAFHMSCIDTWLLSHSTCPLCRMALQPECWIADPDEVDAALDSSQRRSSSATISQLPALHDSAPNSRGDIHATTPSEPGQNSQPIDGLRDESCARVVDQFGFRAQSQRSFGGQSAAFTEGTGSFISLSDGMSERASSTLGSGRRVSVKLGKCRFSNQGQLKAVHHMRGGSSASNRSRSKGSSYDYVINPLSLELVVPQLTSSRRLDLAVHPASEYSEANESSTFSESLSLSGCWNTTSFGRVRIGEEKVVAPQTGTWVGSDLSHSSAGTSMRANVSSSDAPSPESSQQNTVDAGICKHKDQKRPSKQSVSFRLPAVAESSSKASVNRRALSENEAFACWDVNFGSTVADVAEERGMEGQRSASFAKRTMEWLVGWQKQRTVYPQAFCDPGFELPEF